MFFSMIDCRPLFEVLDWILLRRRRRLFNDSSSNIDRFISYRVNEKYCVMDECEINSRKQIAFSPSSAAHELRRSLPFV